MALLSAQRRAAVCFAVFIMGFTSLAWQMIIVRELLVVFHGNEFTIGIILANWLLLESMGCYFARRRAERSHNFVASFAYKQFAIGFLALLSILAVRSFRYLLGIPVGEVLGLHYVALISLIVLAPSSLVKGAMFPYASRNFNHVSGTTESAGNVYLIEAIGAFIAGVLFVFYLIYRFDHISIVLILIVANTVSVVIYLQSLGVLRKFKMLVTLVIGVVLISGSLSFHTVLHTISSHLLWYEFRLIDTRNSVYSNITVIEEEEQITFFQNGVPFVTVPNPMMFVEEKSHIPLLLHASPKNVLLIGGGAGGLISEVTKHPIRRVKYVEHDPMIIETLMKYGTPITADELSHEKVSVEVIEGRRYLSTTTETYDCIIVSFPPPATLQLNRFFTVQFFELAKSRLAEGGIFVISLPGSETFLVAELQRLNSMVFRSLSAVFQNVRVIVGEHNIYIASDDRGITAGATVPVQRLLERKIEGGLMTDFYLQYKFDDVRFGSLRDAIKDDDLSALNLDMFPRAVFKSLLLHTLAVSPFLVEILSFVDAIPMIAYVTIILSTVVILVLYQVRRVSLTYVDAVITSTGFSSMTTYVLLIFSFQIYFGYVYHYIGILTGVFMLGTAFGAFVGLRQPRMRLVCVEFAILAMIGMLYTYTLAEFPYYTLNHVFIFGMMILCGILTGVQFPVAVREYDRQSHTISLNPGKLYAYDLFGAFIGALVSAVILIPTVGITHTVMILLLLKAGSTLLTIIGVKKHS